MIKRISITLLFTVVIAIVGMFAATEVMATDICTQGDCPSICEAGPYTVELAPGFPMIIPNLVTVDGITYSCDPDDPSQGPCKIWAWDFTAGDPSKISFMNLLMPVCCTTPINIVSGDPGLPIIYEPCGDGDPNTDFAQYLCDNYGIRMTSQALNNEHDRFWIATNLEAVPGLTSLLIKQGRNKWPCISTESGEIIGGIVGPDCAPQQAVPIGALTENQCIRLEESLSLGITVNLTDGCPEPTQLRLYTNSTCSGAGTAPTSSVSPSIYCVTPGTDPRCPQCVEVIPALPAITNGYFETSRTLLATASSNCSAPTPNEVRYNFGGRDYIFCY